MHQPKTEKYSTKWDSFWLILFIGNFFTTTCFPRQHQEMFKSELSWKFFKHPRWNPAYVKLLLINYLLRGGIVILDCKQQFQVEEIIFIIYLPSIVALRRKSIVKMFLMLGLGYFNCKQKLRQANLSPDNSAYIRPMRTHVVTSKLICAGNGFYTNVTINWYAFMMQKQQLFVWIPLSYCCYFAYRTLSISHCYSYTLDYSFYLQNELLAPFILQIIFRFFEVV